MQQNQRARLVLGPFTLVLVLVSFGLIAGFGIAHYRGRAPSAETAASVSATLSANGILLSSDHLDFGDVAVNRAVARPLLLRTTGASAVRVRIEGTGAFMVDPESLTLEPGRISRVTVTANPREAGSFKDELRIFADGASKAPLVVVLKGNARAAGDMIAQGELGGPAGTSGEAGSGVAQGYGSAVDGPGGVSGTRAADGSASGSVQITRSGADGEEGFAGDADAGVTRSGKGAAPGTVVVPFDPSQAHRSLSDRPNVPSSDAPPRAGEEPSPLGGEEKKPADLEKKESPDEPPSNPTLVVSQSSTLTALGSKNRFYPQQIAIVGSASGGSFSLSSSLQLPRVPIAFGQTLVFNQSGFASGDYDAASGQVNLTFPMEAIDPNGNAAVFPMPMTTGSVVRRNNSGVLVSLTGQPRSPDSGVLHLVGIEKIPQGFKNSAEEQFVLVEIWASLNFPTSRPSDTSGGGN